jgi:hypothetical protein
MSGSLWRVIIIIIFALPAQCVSCEDDKWCHAMWDGLWQQVAMACHLVCCKQVSLHMLPFLCTHVCVYNHLVSAHWYQVIRAHVYDTADNIQTLVPKHHYECY